MENKKEVTVDVRKNQDVNKKELFVKYAVLACKVIGCLFFVALFAYFLRNKGFYLKKVTDPETSLVTYAVSSKTLKRGAFAIFASGMGIVLCLAPNKLSDKVNKIISMVSCLLSPWVAFLILEYLNQSKWLNFKPFVFWMNIVILYFVFFTFTAILGSMKRGSIASIILACVFALTNFFVFQCRGIAFLASDIKIAGTAVGVLDNFDFAFTFQCVYTIGYSVLMLVYYLRLKDECKFNAKKYFARLAVWVVVCAAFIYSFMYTDLIKGVYFKTFRPDRTYKSQGQALTFVRSIHMIMAQKPEEYSASKAYEVYEKYGSDVIEASAMDEDAQSTKDEPGVLTETTEENPNIIVVMCEAFSDLGTVGEFEVNQDYMPFIHTLSENTIKGTTYVSIFGGRTANTEYEMLTGNSQAFLPDGSTTYQFFLKDNYPSIVRYLKNKGYQGLDAIHPYYKVGYNRINVYNYFGFNNYYALEDFENPDILRKYITDECNYKKMIELYEEAKKESSAPYFSFTVTMQNHSSFGKEYADMPHDIVLSDEYYDFTADQYLNLVKVSDSALEDFIGYFKNVDEPTVIVFFGDHQPRVSNAFYSKIMGKGQMQLTDEENMEMYKTPFLAWANFDIEEKDNVVTSTNYLMSTIMDGIGLDMPKYNRLLLEFQKQVPVLTAVGYRGADGKYYSLDDETSPYKEVIDEYNMLQYNELFDRKNWVPSLWDDAYVK